MDHIVLTKRAQETTLKAAELINKCGWTQGAVGSFHEGFCVAGALMKCLDFTNMDNLVVVSMIIKTAAEVVHDDRIIYNGLGWYNDYVLKSKEETVSFLKEVSESF